MTNTTTNTTTHAANGANVQRRTLVVPIGRPTFDLELGAQQVAAATEVLVGLGADASGDQTIVTDVDELDASLDEALANSAGDPEVVVILQATFSDSTLVGRVADRVGSPIVVWSFPEARTGDRLRLNSLCGANLAAYLLRRRAHRVEFVHVDPSAEAAAGIVAGAIERVIEDVPVDAATGVRPHGRAADPEAGRSIAARLGSRRIGVVGDPPNGFEPCAGDVDEMREVTGIEVDRVPLPTLFDEADAAPAAVRTATIERVRATMDLDAATASAGLDESVALHAGLRALADRHGWSALATRCWPECMTEYGGAVCTPMAMLTEDGVPGVCEADLYGAATALILREVAGSDPFVADLVDSDEHDDTSVVWHCGVAPVTLADPDVRPVAITHPNRHRALANQFALKPGRVTVARLSQAGGVLSMVIGGGEVLRRPRPFQGTCAVLRWDQPVSAVMDTVFGCGLEHHVGIVYGDHGAELESLAAAWDLPVIRLGVDRAMA
jgi:L-fucose isomerase-like protein